MADTTETGRLLTHEELLRLIDVLVGQLREQTFDHVLIISRGGLVPGGYLSKRVPFFDVLTASIMWYKGEQKLEHPVILQFPPETLLNGKRILVIDDVWHTGGTLDLVRHMCQRAGATVSIATLHYKPRLSTHDGRPDFYAEETDEWIIYPWELEEGQT